MLYCVSVFVTSWIVPYCRFRERSFADRDTLDYLRVVLLPSVGPLPVHADGVFQRETNRKDEGDGLVHCLLKVDLAVEDIHVENG